MADTAEAVAERPASAASAPAEAPKAAEPAAAASAPAAAASAPAAPQADESCPDKDALAKRIMAAAKLEPLEDSALKGGAQSQAVTGVAGLFFGGAVAKLITSGGPQVTAYNKIGKAVADDKCGVEHLGELPEPLPTAYKVFGQNNKEASADGKKGSGGILDFFKR